MRLRLNFDRITNIALLATSVWIAYALYTLPTAPPRPIAETYKAGEVVSIQNLDLATADSTLLLFVRSTCTFCTQSMPFYSSLAHDMRARRSTPVHIVVVTTDDHQTASAYLAAYAVQVDEIVPGMAPPPKVTGTPTLVLTSRGGVVQKAWIGKLDESREREVRKAVGL